MKPKELAQLLDRARAEKWELLDLSDRGLTHLPAEIGTVISVTRLYLASNHLTELPPEIGQLTRLEVLDLKGNKLRNLPPELANLTNLAELYLGFNRVTPLPDTLFKLHSLNTLGLTDNHIRELPADICQLTHLRDIYLGDNLLRSLPPEIGELTRLSVLALNGNQLESLPPEIGRLTNLTKLDLRRNKLTSLPPEIEQLSHLNELELSRNNLPLPPEIIDRLDEPSVIINYYLQHMRTRHKKMLHEAKMLIVGQGGVGKTQIVNRLLFNRFNEIEPRTEGIDIHPWHIKPDDHEIKVNIWDFGGQEIMHATHQFFLTQRSLYLLVWDARQEDRYGQIDYWLKLVQSFGGDSPVIVVLNKIDAGYVDLDRRELRKKYPNIRDFISISCKTGQNLDDLQRSITAEICRLPHIDDEMLTSWYNVKTELEAITRDYIEYQEYEKMCEAQGLDRLSQETLINFLHDLGVVLNFHDDLRLRDTNILNPEWVTNGVYQVLNYQPLHGKGILDAGELFKILKPPKYPRSKHRFILDMMEKFELCFELENRKGFYLIPELLPKEAPEFQWDFADSLAFQYHYNFFPMSVISRFLVRMHPFIDGECYWKSGVILTDGHNRALIKADRDERRIFIWVTGRQTTRREFLAKIRGHFEHIHATIARIEAREKVPLAHQTQVVVDYNHLLKLELRGIETYFPEGADDEIRVVDLLNGVRPVHSSYQDLESQLKLLGEKLRRLRNDRILATDSAVKFRLDKEIAEAEKHQTQLEQEIELLERRAQ